MSCAGGFAGAKSDHPAQVHTIYACDMKADLFLDLSSLTCKIPICNRRSSMRTNIVYKHMILMHAKEFLDKSLMYS